ncbi:MAG: hypothetical protein WBB63_07560 [Sphingobacterium thalpophilum]
MRFIPISTFKTKELGSLHPNQRSFFMLRSGNPQEPKMSRELALDWFSAKI